MLGMCLKSKRSLSIKIVFMEVIVSFKKITEKIIVKLKINLKDSQKV